MTLTADGWRASDVGKYVRLNSGLVKITIYTSALVVSGRIIVELTATTAVPALAWTLESTVWGTAYGYPQAGTLHEQRLVVAGTTKYPQTVWGSRTGEVLDFTIGTADDDSFSFTVSDSNNQTNQISYVFSARSLLILTHGGEFSMQSGVEKPMRRQMSRSKSARLRSKKPAAGKKRCSRSGQGRKPGRSSIAMTRRLSPQT
jgi:hypothetical protein